MKVNTRCSMKCLHEVTGITLTNVLCFQVLVVKESGSSTIAFDFWILFGCEFVKGDLWITEKWCFQIADYLRRWRKGCTPRCNGYLMWPRVADWCTLWWPKSTMLVKSTTWRRNGKWLRTSGRLPSSGNVTRRLLPRKRNLDCHFGVDFRF